MKKLIIIFISIVCFIFPIKTMAVSFAELSRVTNIENLLTIIFAVCC